MKLENQIKETAIVLQARMGSSRLPNKILKNINGSPLLWHIIQRLKQIHPELRIILATSTLSENKILKNFAVENEIHFFAGSEEDVLDRYYKCAQSYNLKNIVRATGDNPFVDVEAGSKLLDFYFRKNLDYSDSFTPGLPKGMGLEIFSFDALKESWEKGLNPHHREHVNEYIIENPTHFKIEKLPFYLDKDLSELSLTVDTQKEFNIAEQIYSSAKKQKLDHIDLHWITKNFLL